MSTKLVIKVSEARAILAMGNALDAPSIQTNREGNLIYYTADPREMTDWRSANTSGEAP